MGFFRVSLTSSWIRVEYEMNSSRNENQIVLYVMCGFLPLGGDVVKAAMLCSECLLLPPLMLFPEVVNMMYSTGVCHH